MNSLAGWHPIAAVAELPPGHVYQTRLGGFPLAVWASSSGEVNVWEDRCPHRGVRFSIGNIVNDELRCQYHAWRFASGSGACTAIPAHPRNKPAAAICAKVFPAAVRGGLVWTRLADSEAMVPNVPAGVALRPISCEVPAEAASAALANRPIAGATIYVQPVTEGRSVLRGIAGEERPLNEIDEALECLRHELEK